MNLIDDLRQSLEMYGTGPRLEDMPHNTLEEKGIAGPTAAHRIEEIHTPLNLAYTTFTTGSSAFQNVVGVTWQEIPARIQAGVLALERAGVPNGSEVIVTYPPLVNVFSNSAFQKADIKVRFIRRPSRDALLVELCTGHPRCVIGESSFLRSALQDAKKLGLYASLPSDLILIAAGSPLDPELVETVSGLPKAQVHDLYGCQEFGWLTLDGVPLRNDILLLEDSEADGRQHLIVGGIPTGDTFLLGRHPLNPEGKICTNTRQRSACELETTILSCDAARDTALRAARTILRLKAKIIRVSSEYYPSKEGTHLILSSPDGKNKLEIRSPEKTKLLDDLIHAQKMYQREAKIDPVWNKQC